MMSEHTTEALRELLDDIYRAESRRILATLIRLLGDFDLAEEALHEAFRAALEQWPREGVPANPKAWLVSAGRFKAIDAIRRRLHHRRVIFIESASRRVHEAVVLPRAASPKRRPHLRRDRPQALDAPG